MSVLCIVQARYGSTRLPGKAFMDIGGKRLIEHVMERVYQIRGVDTVALAVPHGEVAAFQYGRYVHGPMVPETDVLARFAAVLRAYPEADTVMRITGDCPLFNPRIAEQVLDLFRRAPYCEYAWNVASGYVDGEDCEVFSANALRLAHRCATSAEDREHVTSWIRRNYPVATLQPETDRSGLKTSVDTLEDLERVRAIVAGERPKGMATLNVMYRLTHE